MGDDNVLSVDAAEPAADGEGVSDGGAGVGESTASAAVCGSVSFQRPPKRPLEAKFYLNPTAAFLRDALVGAVTDPKARVYRCVEWQPRMKRFIDAVLPQVSRELARRGFFPARKRPTISIAARAGGSGVVTVSYDEPSAANVLSLAVLLAPAELVTARACMRCRGCKGRGR